MAIAIALAASLPAAARAELLYFTNGGQIQHAAEVKGGVVRLDTPAGVFEFPERAFRRIVPGFCPAAEWPARATRARRGTTGERLSAAWWALENGLIPEAAAILREAHKSDPKDPQCARLVALLDRLERDASDADSTRLENALGVSCKTTRGRHVRLFHQHSTAQAEERVDLLERVFTAYYLFFAWHGIDLQVPTEVVSSVYLGRKSDYVAFLKAQNAGAFAGTLGYYHPTFKSVVAFDVRSDERHRDEGRLLDRLESESRSLPDDRRIDLQRRRLLFELECRSLDLGTAAHEMIHQLVVASGLAPSSDAFPLWLHEGLATQFEVIRGGRWAGIGRAHDLRLADWRGVSAHPRLVPLLRGDGFGHGYQRALYARSWSFVFFLSKRHPEALYSYVDAIRNRDHATDPLEGSDPSRAILAILGSAPSSLEREWQEFMAGVSTPLEDHSSVSGEAFRPIRQPPQLTETRQPL